MAQVPPHVRAGRMPALWSIYIDHSAGLSIEMHPLSGYSRAA